MYKIEIKITKDILQRSIMCGIGSSSLGTNCAVALALREVFPRVWVDDANIYLNGFSSGRLTGPKISTPVEMAQFIVKFDELEETPEKRLDLPEQMFQLEFSDEFAGMLTYQFKSNHPSVTYIKLTHNQTKRYA